MVNIWSIKAVEIKTLIVFNLVFANNILSCFSVFFMIIDLYFLIHAMISQVFISTTELAIPIGTPTNEANAETDHITTTESRNKSKKMFEVIQSPIYVFLLFTH